MLKLFKLLVLVAALVSLVAILFLEGIVPYKHANVAVKSTKQAPKQPHIIFVLSDDQGFHDIGYHGSEIQTPTLDALAASGVKLENYYVQPSCTPTRSQLMSGRYQIHTGLQHEYIEHKQPNALPLDSPILAEKMKESGYKTHMVGKWHLGFYKEEYLPYNRGFDTFYGMLCGSGDHFNHKVAGYLDLRSQDGPDFHQTGHYSTNLFTEKAVDVVNKHSANQPLFLYLAYQATHLPMQVPEKYLKKYKHIKDRNRRIYAGMVSALDEGVANLTKALKNKGLWENTILVYTTDNGGASVGFANNYPLKGWKGDYFDGGIRSLGFVCGGALKTSGVVNKELLHVTDWYPTLVGLAQGTLNGTKPLDGLDQWDTISNSAPSRRRVLLHNIDPLFQRRGSPLYNDTFDTSVSAAIRVGHMKLITGWRGSVSGKWSGATYGKQNLLPAPKHAPNKNVWLFNMTADPREFHDVSHQYPEIVKSMLDTLHQLNQTAVPVSFPPWDKNSNPKLHGNVWGPWQK